MTARRPDVVALSRSSVDLYGEPVSGTHLCGPDVEAASLVATDHARAAGTRVVLDIDYRPVL